VRSRPSPRFSSSIFEVSNEREGKRKTLSPLRGPLTRLSNFTHLLVGFPCVVVKSTPSVGERAVPNQCHLNRQSRESSAFWFVKSFVIAGVCGTRPTL